MSLNVDQSGIWVGYHSSGLEHYSFNKQEKIYYGVDEENKLSSNAVTRIVTTRSGEILVGTYGGGLNIISEVTGIESISVGDNKVIMLHETNEGPVLVGTESGLFFFYISSRKLQKVSFNYSNKSFFSEPLFWSVGESENGDLWLGSKLQGLFLWRVNRLTGRYPDKIKPLTQHMKNLTIYALEIDGQGNVWMSTNSGLLNYNPSDDEIKTYSILYGLNKTKFDHGVSHKDFRGNIYFGGNSGYVRFDPSSIRFRTMPPPISLNKIESASNSAGFNRLSPPIPSSIQLAYTDYFVKFTFSVLDFLDPDKNHYRYKLEGFDPEWIDNGTRNTATYTNLPAGNYVFRAQGANSAGIWNREGLSIEVEVLPAWWLTWWAYTFYALSLACAVWVLMRWYHTYKVKESALETARNMHEVALGSEDDLQEQYEIQDWLLQSVFHHNTSTLKLVNDCIASQSHCISDDIYREAVEKSTRRVNALALFEDCIYHHGDTILADLKKYVDKIISELLRDAPVPAETVTTINDISSRLLPVAVGSPLAIIIFELLENSLHHAFEPGSPANYIHLVSSIERLDTGDHLELYALSIQDSGLGIPGNIDLSALETSGLAIVQSLVTRLSGKLQICAEGGTKASVVVPIPRD
jgi:two-component sensor histidine kinase